MSENVTLPSDLHNQMVLRQNIRCISAWPSLRNVSNELRKGAGLHVTRFLKFNAVARGVDTRSEPAFDQHSFR